MNEEVVLVVPLIHYAIVAEWNVANSEVKEAVGQIGILVSLHGNVGVLIELPGDPACDGVQLYAVQFAPRHALGKQAEEVTNTAGRLQYIARSEAHVLNALVYGFNNRGACVIGIERR